MQKIITHLWYDSQLEEAVNLYTSLFKNSRVISKSHYGKSGAAMSGRPEGSVMTMEFELDGQRFMGINAGPMFTFNESVSLLVQCDTQEEIDHFWNGLIANGGEESQCGWLKDPFGLSWQIVPASMGQIMKSGDAAATERVMAAMMPMKKLDVASLEVAARGE